MKGSFENSHVKITADIVYGFKRYLPSFHEHMEIVYVMDGKLNLCIDGQDRELSSSELSISFPYTIHSYAASPGATVIKIMFSPKMVELYEKALYANTPVVPYITNAQDILPLLMKILEYLHVDEKLTFTYLTAAVGEITRKLELRKRENLDFSAMQLILMYCSEHFRENITAKNLAAALFLSESYISKIFSKKIGCSFRDYINTLRISEAKKLLKNTDTKITDIMYACGFNNQSSFNRIFYDYTGCTPYQYRHQTRAQ